jgi:hypothetical protein
MIARVRGVIAASIRAGSMFAVSSSTSTNTGLAPSSTIISAVATNVNGVVTISSPGFTPKRHQRDQQRFGAGGHRDAVPSTGIGFKLLLELAHLGTHDVLAMVEHALNARIDALLELAVLRFQIDEIHRSKPFS